MVLLYYIIINTNHYLLTINPMIYLSLCRGGGGEDGFYKPPGEAPFYQIPRVHRKYYLIVAAHIWGSYKHRISCFSPRFDSSWLSNKNRLGYDILGRPRTKNISIRTRPWPWNTNREYLLGNRWRISINSQGDMDCIFGIRSIIQTLGLNFR